MNILQQDFTENGFDFSTNKSKIPIDEVHHFLATQSYWAQNIPMTTLLVAIEHSICIVILYEGKLAGFGRMITDRATFAYLADIFVIEQYRGQSLSKKMMHYFLQLITDFGLRRSILTTQDAHSLYAQFDFIPFPWPERLMMYKNGKYYTSSDT